ncbi:hypothetical protein OF83DRAFT_818432 [Amylostereum chailletii]|nr:hypothetical protein OF83DRAFT_818432 [Amylostereum chailletii]
MPPILLLPRLASRRVLPRSSVLEAYVRNTGSVYPSASFLRSSQKGRATRSDSLTDNSENLWYGKVSVGTSAKTFTVDFATGSSDLFLIGPSCGSTCSGHTICTPSDSSTCSGHTICTPSDSSTSQVAWQELQCRASSEFRWLCREVEAA